MHHMAKSVLTSEPYEVVEHLFKTTAFWNLAVWICFHSAVHSLFNYLGLFGTFVKTIPPDFAHVGHWEKVLAKLLPQSWKHTLSKISLCYRLKIFLNWTSTKVEVVWTRYMSTYFWPCGVLCGVVAQEVEVEWVIPISDLIPALPL